MSDRHIRRPGSAYASALAGLLPRGAAWPRDNDSLLMRVIRALAQIWGSSGVDSVSDAVGTQLVDGRAADLLERESDPRQTIELLQDWERNWGLPDPCFLSTPSIADRQNMLVFKMTLLGGQSRQFFMDAANFIGQQILIKEFAPFMCGVSRCGDTRDLAGQFRWYIGPPEQRFYWTTNVHNARLTWFRAGSSQAGIDSHLEIGIDTDVQCLLDRWKPAHTQIVYDYSSLLAGGSMAGTP